MLTKEFISSYPKTLWNDIIRMRHLMVHGYYHISPEIVKENIETELPILRQQILMYLKKYE